MMSNPDTTLLTVSYSNSKNQTSLNRNQQSPSLEWTYILVRDYQIDWNHVGRARTKGNEFGATLFHMS